MTRRLLISYIAITAVVLAVLEIPLGIVYAQREEERLIADAERDAVVLASFYEDVLHLGDPPDPAPAYDYASRTGARVVVVDVAGLSVLDTDQPADSDERRDFSTRAEIETALSGVRSAGIRSSETLQTDLLFVAVPVASGGVVHGALRSSIDAQAVRDRIQRFWLGLGAAAAVALLVVVAAGWAIAQSVTRPIRRLQASALRFADGNLEPVSIEADAAPEVRSFAETMNTMALRLDHLLREQQAFVGDASHQLRTPLTAMRLRLENLQADLDDQGQADEVEAAIEETERLSDLVNALLQLARADEPQQPLPADAAAIASERVDTWSALAEEAGVPLTLTTPDDAPVWVVPGALEQVLDNLIDNAIAASRAGATIELEVVPQAGLTSILVIDHGPGLDDAQKAQAVERFWRAEPSTPGTGLGLAIVAALVAASDGLFELEDTPGGGLTARVTLGTGPSRRSAEPRGSNGVSTRAPASGRPRT